MTTPDFSNGPLSGLRVIDLTQVFAGPSCGLLLTYLGAEVIKLESLSHLDSTRGQPLPDDPHPWDHAPLWNEMNGGKKSIQVNLKSPQGVELVTGVPPEIQRVRQKLVWRCFAVPDDTGLDAHANSTLFTLLHGTR